MIASHESLTHILDYCKKNLTPVNYLPGEVIVDHAYSPYLYIFESGNFSVKTRLLQWANYEIGNIHAPDIMGEWILFGHEMKAVRVESIDSGVVYQITKEDIDKISLIDANFYRDLTTVCLLSSNSRINEANIERMLLYTMGEYLEDHEQKNVIPLLQSMKHLFDMNSIYWIERHEILEDVFAIRYSSENIYPINELIDMKPYKDKEWICIRGFEWENNCTFIFSIRDTEKIYGYIAISHAESEKIPWYIARIFHHMNSLFIGVIEKEWKKRWGYESIRWTL